ncbi:MAG TPA: type 1 glutamine amidotransferase [Candidatus Eisenbacteria bacterium]|nr:type 1 glutamine amidotransferase [Candidatus Eisenbacteria bacterium]
MNGSVLVLQHVAPETPGLIADALRARGVPFETVHTHAGDPVPRSASGLRGLVVMGGPMGVYEQETHPHLAEEIELIRSALASGLPILGVCLGSQLLAAALGARVTPGTKEIGWLPVELTEDAAQDALWRGVRSPITPFHWHGDAFELPAGARRLARSEVTSCQAFSYGDQAYGLLFHLEVSAAMVHAMARAFGHELEAAGVDGEAILCQTLRAVSDIRETAALVLGRWADLLQR